MSTLGDWAAEHARTLSASVDEDVEAMLAAKVVRERDATSRKLGVDYRDTLAAYLRGEQVTTRKGRPWPKDERTRTAARMLLKRIAECEPPLPVVHEQPPHKDAI